MWKRNAPALKKELAETKSQIERLEKFLGSDFANKAPAPVVDKEREKLAAYQETAGKISFAIGIEHFLHMIAIGGRVIDNAASILLISGETQKRMVVK